ncbi:tetratricopeptide (TPR) repeat protein [Actinokineospora baliensis]|uniref:NACHT domain-containing protein n=1 Tax=Actinokineospora baliensis TaxID=547056 RepID=UPI001EF8FAB4|nr:hypothetical protein [Actinokineospora baliensis]MBM7774975.1 tetratricopeptide (TPR) repeat protein [Actinokineospora baliensis]
MADARNEITGGHFTGPVVQAGRIDKVVFGGEPVDHPPLRGWDPLPEITPALVDLLEAQREAVDTLPYRLLGVRRPELAKVYVQQRIRVREEPDTTGRGYPAASGDGTERPVSAGEALDRGGHLVITGEPGAGKSTLGNMYVQQICDCWLGVEGAQPPLSEPVLPLRIPARVLAEDRSWSDLLAAGVEDAVGRLLTSAPDPALFAKRAFGARWLVFIDGLDEIADRATREQVVRAITARMRRSEHYRIVVTTRPLPDAEMAPFDQVGADSYTIQPFGALELAEFANAWFRAQSALTARARAEAFVSQVSGGRLRELVRNPLLATITAIAHTLEPHRELPRSTASLYQRFMDYLLTDETSGRRTRDELRRTLEHTPDRLALAIWMDDHRVDLIEALAVVRLDTDTPLWDAARDWVLANQTAVPRPPADWEEDMRAVLASSGVFVRTEDTLRFSHQSFAEFIAARNHARAIDPAFTAMDDWIERGLRPSTQDYALFTFVLWGSQGNDLTLVLRELLAKGTDHVVLAGKLLTGDLPVDRDITTEIVDRLVDALLLSRLAEDPQRLMAKLRGVLAAIGVHQDVVVQRLRRVRENTDLVPYIRIEAVVAVGVLDDRDAALAWLEDQAIGAEPDVLLHICAGIEALEADSGPRIERLVTRLASGSAPDYVVTMAHIAMLADAERTAAAAELATELVAAIRADPRTAADPDVVPRRSSAEPGVLRFRDSWADWVIDTGTHTWAGLAELLGRVGLSEDAAWAARNALAVDSTADEFAEAARVLLAAQGRDAVALLVESAATRPAAHVLGCAEAIREHSPEDAAALARSCLNHSVDVAEMRQAVALVLAAGTAPESLVAEVLAWPLSLEHRMFFGDALATRGQAALARPFLRDLIAEPSMTKYDYWWAVRTLLKVGDESDRAIVLEDALGRSPALIAQAAPLLHREGMSDQAADLVRRVVDGKPEPRVLLEAHLDFGSDAPERTRADLLDAVLAQLHLCSCDELRKLAAGLHEDGRHDEAAGVFRKALGYAMNIEDSALADIAESWLEVYGVRGADELVVEVLKRDLPAQLRLDVARQVAEFGLLPQAVRLWTDIAVHHGHQAGSGIAAAELLVRTGHRSTVDEALADMLAQGGFSAAARTRLGAVRAWVAATAQDPGGGEPTRGRADQ